jgi:hypothetical protein
MANNLESRIQDIVYRAAAEIAGAVRANIAEEVQKVVGGQPSGRRGRRAAAVAAPTARGRGRGRAAGRRGRRSVTEADLKTVLDFITKNPGKRSEEIRAALDLDQDLGGKILAKLRQAKSVKTRGEKRSTTYFTAG